MQRENKTYALIDYKGKWEIIQDKIIDEDWDIVVGVITEEEITDEYLENHVEACIYYGIPPYYGTDKKLNKRVKILLDKYDKEHGTK